jgi:phosphohistidine phosphatase
MKNSSMLKRLLIIRHAKSDWDDPKLSDFDRPLNNRGHRNAPAMAKRLLKKHLVPQQLVSSPAKRAITTAEYFADVFKIDKKDIRQENGIYEASSSGLIKLINELDNDYNFVALFGHNPGLSDLVMRLSNGGGFNIPTCGVVLIQFFFDDWKLIGNGTGELQFFDYPKNI